MANLSDVERSLTILFSFCGDLETPLNWRDPSILTLAGDDTSSEGEAFVFALF